MTTRESKIEEGGWPARSILECGDLSPHSPSTSARANAGDESPARQSAVKSAHSKVWRTASACCLLSCAFCLPGWGQYSINWFTIDGGGGTSTGGVYSVSGTIGQADATPQPLTGGNYSLTGGFWAGLVVVQQPDAPTLFITPAGPNATLSWTPATPGFVLQESATLSPPAWTNAPSGALNPATVPAGGPMRYFRLRKP